MNIALVLVLVLVLVVVYFRRRRISASPLGLASRDFSTDVKPFVDLRYRRRRKRNRSNFL